MLASAQLAAILAMATSAMPEGLARGLADDPDRFNDCPVDTLTSAEPLTRSLTDLDPSRIAAADAKRARKREKYRGTK